MTRAPSLQPRYRTFDATTDASVPARPVACRTAGSHVPQAALRDAPAALTPDAMRTVDQVSSAPCSGDGCTAPFGQHLRFRRFIERFTFVRLRRAHVTVGAGVCGGAADERSASPRARDGSLPAFSRNAHHLARWDEAASGRLARAPAGAGRRAFLHAA